MSKLWTDVLETQLTGPRGISIYNALMNANWENTSLGPIADWPAAIRHHVRFLLQSPRAMALYLGPDLVLLYNRAALDIYGSRHPFMMGKPIDSAFADLAERVELTRLVREAFTTGVTGHVPMSSFLINREVLDLTKSTGAEAPTQPDLLVASWDAIPLIDDDGTVLGVQCPLSDGTELFLARAKDQFLNKVATAREEPGTKHREDALGQAFEAICDAFENVPILYPLGMMFELIRSESNEIRYKCRVNVGATDQMPFDVVLGQDEAGISQWHDFIARVYDSKQPVEFQEAIHNCARRALGVRTDSGLIYPIFDQPDSRNAQYIIIIGACPVQQISQTTTELLFGACAAITNTLKHLSQRSALRDSERRFRQIVELLPVGIQIEEFSTRQITYVNPYWRALFGVPADLTVQDPKLFETALSRVHPSSHQTVTEYAEIKEKGHIRPSDVRLTTPGLPMDSPDDEIWVRVATNEFGKDEILALSTNISDHYNGLRRVRAISKLEADRDLNQHRADLAEQQTSKHLEFIDYFSHELRNPLGAIFHSLELCLEKESLRASNETSSELREDLLTINLCSRHMQRIMDDTLLFSQLQSGKLAICRVPTQVPALFEHVIGMFRSECRAKKIEITLDTTEWAHSTQEFLLDPNRTTQILINLITNSMKFAPRDRPGSITVQIGSRSSDDKGRTILSCAVIDNGLAMTDAEINKLFQRFQQANQKTHVDYGGSGLGLYICRTLVELMDGTISACRNDRGGTTFAFELRCEIVQSETDWRTLRPKTAIASKLDNIVPTSNVPISENVDKDEKLHTVLVVEDNQINQRLLQRQLEKSGYKVMVANNGQEAVDIFKSKAGTGVDICLCDIEMPVLNGYETVCQVRAYEASLNRLPTPFLAISANARPEQVQRQLDAGMTASLTKPFQTRDLLQKLRTMLAQHQY